jgi:cyclopropane fatty-acyl-phospholipid synthase-like methyltransferase
VAHAEENAKHLIECANFDTYRFRQSYEVLLALDVFEHVEEQQLARFLKRSRKHIDDCIFAVIALNTPRQRLEPSHYKLETREYWHRLFLDCGWEQPKEFALMQKLAHEHEHIKNDDCAVFIYSAGRKTFALKVWRALLQSWNRARAWFKG